MRLVSQPDIEELIYGQGQTCRIKGVIESNRTMSDSSSTGKFEAQVGLDFDQA